MNYIKLQLGCFLIVLYFVFVYVRDMLKTNLTCNKSFDMLLYLCPSYIFFDGITAFFVNHQDLISHSVLIALHAAFFCAVVLTIVAAFFYMVDLTAVKNKTQLALLLLPCMLAIALILYFIDDLVIVNGVETNYSQGFAVIVAYACVAFYFALMFIITIRRYKTIASRKRNSIFAFLIMSSAIMIYQACNPEALITALAPVLLVIGPYIAVENPAARSVEVFNEEMVMAFATLVENRDTSTGGHIKRTKAYVKILLDKMKESKEYRNIITKDFENNVLTAAPMHDLGKIATPDSILQKPSKLTDDEYNIMKKHAAKGEEIIKSVFADMKEPDFFAVTRNIARYHHEKWSGKGYPDGLAKDEIPLEARIMAIADVFDAISANRCYRAAMPLEKCFAIIEEGAGKDFDAKLVELFLQAKDEITAYCAQNV